MNGHITKMTSGAYRITIEHPKTPDGKRQRTYKTVKCTKREADMIMKAMMAELDTCIDQRKRTIMTVSELYTLFRGAKESKLKYKSMKFYDDNFYINVEPYIGDIKITDLAPLRIEQLYEELTEPRGDAQRVLSRNSIHAVHRVLRAMFNWAYKKQIIVKNVMLYVDSPPTEKNESGHMTYNEMITLLEHNKDSYHIGAIATACFTGMRISEILGLTWDDIDLDAGTIKVKAQLSKIPYQDAERITTKTESSVREIPIFTQLKPYLEYQKTLDTEVREKLGDDYDGNYVFFQLDGSPWHSDSVSHAFKRMATELGRPDMRLHGLRHSFVTWILDLGFDIGEAQKILGHVDAQMISRIYRHISVEQLKAKAKALGIVD